MRRSEPRRTAPRERIIIMEMRMGATWEERVAKVNTVRNHPHALISATFFSHLSPRLSTYGALA